MGSRLGSVFKEPAELLMYSASLTLLLYLSASCSSTDVSLHWMVWSELHTWDAMALLVLTCLTAALCLQCRSLAAFQSVQCTVHITRSFTKSDEFRGKSAWIPCEFHKAFVWIPCGSTLTRNLVHIPFLSSGGVGVLTQVRRFLMVVEDLNTVKTLRGQQAMRIFSLSPLINVMHLPPFFILLLHLSCRILFCTT